MRISVDSTEWLINPLFPGIWFCGVRKTGVAEKKRNLGARTTTNNKLNPDMTRNQVIEPEPH